MDINEQMDKIYRDNPLEKIPWNILKPPTLLIELIASGKVKPCEAVDLGCGAGNYAVWLAQQDFDVTGIDISKEAIKHAEQLASQNGVRCRFVVRDILNDLTDYHAAFGFALDWEVLHHIFPEDRPKYIRNVHSMLRPSGIYFSICFSEEDPGFGGKGNYRETPLGTTLYFSSEKELRDLYTPLFDILEFNTVIIPGKYNPHTAIAALLKRN